MGKHITLLHAAALKYAAVLHWPVFPLKPKSKVPLTKNGFKDATTDEKQINEWWTKWPDANIGIPTGKDTFDVLDVDSRNGGNESLERLTQQHGPLPNTVQQITGSGDRHYLFRPGGCLRNGNLGPGLDVKSDGGYIVVAPSVHPHTGKQYEWDGIDLLENQPILPVPDFLRRQQNEKTHRVDYEIPGVVPDGKKHDTIVSLAGTLRARDLPKEAAFAACRTLKFESPVEDADIWERVESVYQRYPPGTDSPTTIPGPRTGQVTLADVHRVFGTWLHLPDNGIVTITLATVAANRAKGDPTWLLLVGPPASGKTEILDSILGLPDMHPAGTLTEASLLSGAPHREKASDASGGLLRAIGSFGFIVCKDFTSVLAMSRELRGALLGALREIFDGHWIRHVGMDGGRTLRWSGKAVLLAGVTPIVDQHHAVMAAMGERFLFCRLPDVQPLNQARIALKHAGKEYAMRKQLREAVSGLFKDFQPQPFTMNEAISDRLSALATLTARCRSAVERDSYHRDIELVPGSERPARLVLSLARLYHGMKTIGVAEKECWRLLTATGMVVYRLCGAKHLMCFGSVKSRFPLRTWRRLSTIPRVPRGAHSKSWWRTRSP